MKNLQLFTVIALAVLAPFTLVSCSSDSSSKSAVVGLCPGEREVKPATITLACGDGNEYVDKIEWAEWSNKGANGTGVLATNNCVPDCSQGKMEEVAVKVELSGPVESKGKLVFTNIKIDGPNGTETYTDDVTSD